MVRSGGITFTLDVAAASGQRISNLRLKRNGQAIEASRDYVVAGWASINQSVEGPPIWDLVFRYLAKGPVSLTPRNDIELRGIG
jgi:sulfur-oxidizing protein SoxB